MPIPSTAKSSAKTVRHARIIQGAAFCVASVLAALLLTEALPTIVADQSDRAILDAPVALLTSPIAGEVTMLNVSVGDHLDQAANAVEVINSRVDRTTLMSLENKAADSREGLAAATSKLASDLRYLQVLDKQVAAQKTELIKQFELQADELRGDLGAAQAMVAAKRALRDRQVKLVSSDVADPYMLKPTSQELSSAQGKHEAAVAKLAENLAQVAAVRDDIFVGDNLVGIATLAQKRRDVAFDAERQLIEQTQSKSSLDQSSLLVDIEKDRISRLSSATLTAPRDGEVLHVGVSPGRHVNAGDALVSLVDCRSLFAVAIFSYRAASDLTVGTPMSITMEGAKPRAARVTEVIPKSSDATDALYAMPFPQTERREMYVVAKPTEPAESDTGEGSDVSAFTACPVGKWVTVTRQDGWMPSSSVIWHKATGVLTSLLHGSLTSTADASQRKGS